MIFLAIAFFILLNLLAASVAAAGFLAHYKNDRDPDRHLNNEAYIATCKRQALEIEVSGVPIRGDFLPCPSDPGSNRVAVLVHGVTASRRTVGDYVPLFHALGYSVLRYDQPAHGESGGRYITYGRFERQVLAAWAKYVEQTMPGTIYGLFGVSMGAATVLLAGPDITPEFVVADCPYDDFRLQFIHQLSLMLRIPALAARLFAPLAGMACRLLYGFSFADCKPVRRVTDIAVPVLFIHGAYDGFVPCEMSLRMHAKRAAAGLPSRFELFPASHAASFYSDERRYAMALSEFVREAQGYNIHSD